MGLLVSLKNEVTRKPDRLPQAFRQIENWAAAQVFTTLGTAVTLGGGVTAGANWKGQRLLFAFGDASGTTNGSGIVTVTYPKPFPNGVIAVIVVPAFTLSTYKVVGPHTGGVTLKAADILWFGAASGSAPAVLTTTAVAGFYVAVGF